MYYKGGKKNFEEIEKLYKESLNKQEISIDLRLKIKNLFGNFRSLLDYTANDIADVLNIKNKKIYFPIVGEIDDISIFEKAVNRNLPGLREKFPEIYQCLESIQPYNEGYSWVHSFRNICNENKHVTLTPQSKKERKEIKLTNSGNSIKITGEQSVIDIGIDGCIILNDSILTKQILSPESKEIFYQGSKLDIIKQIWVDFKFDGGEVSALFLLDKVVAEIPKIVFMIYDLLENFSKK